MNTARNQYLISLNREETEKCT